MSYFTLKQLKIFKTCNLFLSYAVSGLSMTVVGASLLDLQHVVQTDTETIAFVFVARAGGYLFGLVFGAPLLDKTVRKLLLMTILNFLIAVTMFVVPLSRNVETLMGWMALNGMSIGALDTGLNTYCLNLWGEDSGPIFQAQTFSFGIGGLMAPLIVAPFLGHYTTIKVENSTSSMNSISNFIDSGQALNMKDSYLNPSTISLSTLPYSIQLLNASDDSFNLSDIRDSKDILPNVHDSSDFTLSKVFYGYLIISSIAFLVTVLFLIMCIIAPVDDTGQNTNNEDNLNQSKTFIAIVVTLTFLLLLIQLGLQMGYGQAVATYAVKGPLRLTNPVGSYISSLYWTAFTISRFCAIFYVLKFSNLSLILLCLSITTSGAVVLLSSVTEWSLWLATFLVGFGVSPFFSTAIAWIEQYITVTNKFVALFSTGYCFGEMIGPYVITSYVEQVPEALSYMVVASCVISVPLILGMYLMLRNKPKKYEKKGVSNEAYNVSFE